MKMTKLLFIAMVVLLGSPLTADVEPNNTCTEAEVIPDISTVVGTLYNGDVDYYTYTAAIKTEITFSYTSVDRTDLYVTKNGCAVDQVMNNGTGYDNYSTPIILEVGDSLGFMINNRLNGDNSYKIVINGTYSNMPVALISPATKNIKIGTQSVSMDVGVTECPNTEDVNVTVSYLDDFNATVTQGPFTFETGYCTKFAPITIDIPSWLVVGDTMDINVSAATTGDQLLAPTEGAVITVLSAVSDLSVTKTAPEYIEVGESIDYNITVINHGVDAATDVSMIDTLPELFIDQTVTITPANGWQCDRPAGTLFITCTPSGVIAPGEVASFIVSTPVVNDRFVLFNSVKVESSNDGDIQNNSDFAVTSVVDLSKPDDLCYTTPLETSNGNKCFETGDVPPMLYGPACTTAIKIGNTGSLSLLFDVQVTKQYDENRTSGSCSASEIDVTCVASSDSYGYTRDLMNPLKSFTMTDDGTSSADGSFDTIKLTGSYVKNGLTYAGEIPLCKGGSFSDATYALEGNMDVVDSFDYSTYDDDHSILQTKVVGEQVTVDIVNLNTVGEPLLYGDIPFAVILDLAEFNPTSGKWETDPLNPLTDINGRLVTAELIPPSKNEGVISATSTPFVIPRAMRNAKIVSRFNILSSSIDTQLIRCIERSATLGNLQDMAACFNDEDRLKEIFEQNAATCLNLWTASNAQPYGPCSSNAGNSSFPLLPPYDREPACLSCVIGPVVTAESKDVFAARPDRYDISSENASYPDLLRAGADYNLTLLAYDRNDQNTSRYDQAVANVDDNITKYNSNGSVDATLHGTGGLSGGGNFTDGVTISPAQFTYDDVGDITIDLVDKEWAFVDINNTFDPTPHDCVDDGAYVCGNINVRFIPDHFSVAVDLNNSGNGFTYLNSDGNMTPHMNVQIIAENAAGNPTRNFTDVPANRYENPVTVLLNVLDVPTMTEVKNDINASTLIGFTDGTRTLSWNESNATLAFWFNYARATNKPINPFMVLGSSVVVDVNSTYTTASTPAAPEGTANIDGTDTDDANLTFVYGRSHMARTRAMCDSADCTGNVTFFYEFYGDQDANQTIVNNILGSSPKRSVDSVNWYRNTVHNASSDGNVTAASTPSGSETAALTPFASNTNGEVAYDANTKGYPYKATLNITTDPWLIYDEFNAGATSVTGQLEYYGPGNWTGNGGAEESINNSSTDWNQNSNRRIRW